MLAAAEIMSRATLALLGLVAFAAPANAQTPFDLTEVAWTVSADPAGDRLHLEMRLDPLHQRDHLLLRMPLWRPGSYRYAQYQESLSALKAVDGSGAERVILPCDDRTWQVDVAGATSLTVSYDLAVENVADADATPSIMRHGPATFLYVEDALNLPHTLQFRLPAGWEHASGHRQHPLRADTWYSPNYDVFVDCPLVLGGLERHGFTLRERPFEVVLYGQKLSEEEFPRAAWLEKVKRISDAAFDVVGDFPFERYVYLFGFTDIGGGYGLEHLNSTTIEFNHSIIRSGNLDGLESVTAHEFFHLWNVKRIRPEQLGPFDYATDVRSKDLWWMEGVTSYYNDVILQRAGMRPDPNWFIEAQATVGRTLQGSSGYGKLSPERSSWTVWDGTGRQISYYDQGQALGFLLDVQIRHHTQNRRTLDDVVRFLHRWVNYPEAGLRDGDLERAVRAISGWDCGEFFARYVAGNQRFPYESVLPLAGLHCVEQRIGDPFLGIALDEKLTLTRAEESAGLRAGDRLVRIAGTGVKTMADVRGVSAGLQVGATIELIVERSGNERVRASWIVKERDRSGLSVWRNEEASAEQKAILDGILTGTPGGV